MNKFEPTTSNCRSNCRSGQRETNPAPEPRNLRVRSCEFIVSRFENKKELTRHKSKRGFLTSIPETLRRAGRKGRDSTLTPIERDAESATSDASRRALR
jgi:hypothetical protein